MLRQINTLFDGKFVAIVEPLLKKDDPRCRVVRATLKSGVDAVVKMISNADRGDKTRANREIKLLRKFSDLRAQHICGLRDSTVTAACSAMMLECMELGTVGDFLDAAPAEHTITNPNVAGGATRLRLQSLLHMSTDVLAGLSVMHDNGICHRDIKPANIGATWMPILDRVGFKIIDLGIAVADTAKEENPPVLPLDTASSVVAPALPRRTFMTGICTGIVELKRLRGTILFMSPEQLDKDQQVRDCRA